MYRYRVAQVVRVIDGDSLQLRLDLGLYLTTELRFRVLGVDTPERGEPGWAEATAFTTAWLDASGPLTAATAKADSFGRWLCDLTREDGSGLADALLEAGHAVPYRR